MAMMFILAMLTTLTVQAAADKTALDAAVSEAETYNSSILESNPKQAEVLTMLINSCKTVLNDADATQEDVDFATKFMNESVNQCKIAVAQANYAAAISEAEEYLATIKENYPAQAEKLNNLINNAKAMEGTSMEVLEFVTQVVTEGLQQIKIEVAQADYAAAIAKAEEYLATIQEKHPEQAEKLTNLINNAKAIESTSVDVLEFFTQAVTEGIKLVQLEIAQADFAAAIADAEAYLATIQETHPEQAQNLTNVINNAKSMEGTSMEVLEFITQVLTEGLQQIKMEIAHADLAAAIADAEAYMTTIQESNPSVAEVMQMFINAAKQVQADDSYTQADLEFATAFMKELVVQAKEAVTTGVSAARAATSLAAKYYDLQGRRLSQPSRAGVYINNGVVKVNK
jgi:chemotaxis regulatin CheY-phosphate phosphatase CheZ